MPTYQEIEAQLTAPGALFETTEEEVLGERMTVFRNRKRSLRELLADSAVHGDKEYLALGDRRISYADHLGLVGSTARALAEQYGIEKGDRVAIFAENWPEWIITYWATVSLGGIVAALNGWWTPDEVKYGIELAEPKLLVGDRKRLARVEGLGLDVPTLEIENDAEKLLSYAPGAALPETPIDEDEAAVILFTSGTTGRPKGAVNSHRGIIGFVQTTGLAAVRGMMMAAAKGTAQEENPPPMRTLLTSPLFHLSGLYAGTTLMLASGAAIVLRHGRFEPLEVLRLIEEEHITSWSGLGSMAPRVLNHPDVDKYDLSTLRNLGSGGAPTSPTVFERMKQVAPNGADARGTGYGLSEAVATIAQISGAELEERPTSTGRVTPTGQVEIRDADGGVLPEGQEGEIFFRGPNVMLEYWRNPEATAKTILPGRWLASGDVGRFEGEYLYINSRARDLILRAAENVYPIEIEHRLDAHPDVVESAVIGVDHPELGQEVKAICVPRAGCTLDADVLTAWCREKLSTFKVPSLWEFRSEPLPRNPSGKVLKNVLEGTSEVRFVEE
ncbi:MAG: acyl--CoA ligase [Deltaproteobacteria bacterium]|nr:acyl--CoA ligase [Deltaproteobacteria bacterium]MBW2360204.1 acyl--CoA ligase [Deltaproteobacteria bacterium]